MSEVQWVAAAELRPNDRLVGRQIERITKVQLTHGLVHVSILRPWRSRYNPNRALRCQRLYGPLQRVLIAARPISHKRTLLNRLTFGTFGV